VQRVKRACLAGTVSLALGLVLSPAADARPSLSATPGFLLNTAAQRVTISVTAKHARKVSVTLTGSGGCSVAGCAAQDPATVGPIKLKHKRKALWAITTGGNVFAVATKANLSIVAKACGHACSLKTLSAITQPLAPTPPPPPAPTPTPSPPPSNGSSGSSGSGSGSSTPAPASPWPPILRFGANGPSGTDWYAYQGSICNLYAFSTDPNLPRGTRTSFFPSANGCGIGPRQNGQEGFVWSVNGDTLTMTYVSGFSEQVRLVNYDQGQDILTVTQNGGTGPWYGCRNAANPFPCP
jgi:hypothetical protein